jgi:hypothetical protein
VESLLAVLSVQRELVSTRWSPVFDDRGLAGDQTPLCKRSRAAPFERPTVDDVAFRVELILDVGVGRGELL